MRFHHFSFSLFAISIYVPGLMFATIFATPTFAAYFDTTYQMENKIKKFEEQKLFVEKIKVAMEKLYWPLLLQRAKQYKSPEEIGIIFLTANTKFLINCHERKVRILKNSSAKPPQNLFEWRFAQHITSLRMPLSKIPSRFGKTTLFNCAFACSQIQRAYRQ